MAYTTEQIRAALEAELEARPGTSYEAMLAHAQDAFGLTDQQVELAYFDYLRDEGMNDENFNVGANDNGWVEQDVLDARRNWLDTAEGQQWQAEADPLQRDWATTFYVGDMAGAEDVLADYNLTDSVLQSVYGVSPDEIAAVSDRYAVVPFGSPPATQLPTNPTQQQRDAGVVVRPPTTTTKPPTAQLPPITPAPKNVVPQIASNKAQFTYGTPTAETGGWNNRFTQYPETIVDRATRALAEEMSQRPGSSYDALRTQALRFPGVSNSVFDQAYANVTGFGQPAAQPVEYSSNLIKSLRQAAPTNEVGNTGVSIIPSLTSRTPVTFTTGSNNAFNPPQLQSSSAPNTTEQDFFNSGLSRMTVPDGGWSVDRATQALASELSARPESSYDALRLQALRYPGMTPGLFDQAYQKVTGVNKGAPVESVAPVFESTGG